MSCGVGQLGMAVDPLGHFGFNGLSQHPLRSLSENRRQHILGWRQLATQSSNCYSHAWWRTPGRNVVEFQPNSTQVRRLLQLLLIHNIWLYLLDDGPKAVNQHTIYSWVRETSHQTTRFWHRRDMAGIAVAPVCGAPSCAEYLVQRLLCR